MTLTKQEIFNALKVTGKQRVENHVIRDEVLKLCYENWIKAEYTEHEQDDAIYYVIRLI